MAPLTGFRIIELAGVGPGPFCGMMLSDMGAEVIRVERPSNATSAPKHVLARNRRPIALDLKQPAGVETVLRLVETADALFEREVHSRSQEGGTRFESTIRLVHSTPGKACLTRRDGIGPAGGDPRFFYCTPPASCGPRRLNDLVLVFYRL